MSHQSSPYHVPDASRTAQSYAIFLRDMHARYPNLINLIRELKHPNYNRHCRVRLVDFPRSTDTGHEFHSVQELHDHLGKSEAAPTAPRCTVYVVENLNLEYIAAFGYHFNVDPTVFATQIRTANWESNAEGNNTPKLLLCRDPNRSFTLRYAEPRYFDDHIVGLKLTDDSAGRRITVTTPASGLKDSTHVGLVRRCISFWCGEIHTNCYDGITLF